MKHKPSQYQTSLNARYYNALVHGTFYKEPTLEYSYYLKELLRTNKMAVAHIVLHLKHYQKTTLDLVVTQWLIQQSS